MTPRTGGTTPQRPDGTGVRPPRPGTCLGARLGAHAALARVMDELVGRAGRASSAAPAPIAPTDAGRNAWRDV